MTRGHSVVETDITTDDGERLEGLWYQPTNPRAVLVFCHPHPLHQGTMRAPLMEKMSRRLSDSDVAVFRFNFRGVGYSTGDHDAGIAELADISAAVHEAAEYRPDLPHGLAGWSFGAATSLNWLAMTGSDLPWVGIAPPVRSDASPALPDAQRLAGSGAKTLILGERDQFTTVEEMTLYADSIGAQLTSVGADHFFFGQEDRLAELVEAALFSPDDR